MTSRPEQPSTRELRRGRLDDHVTVVTGASKGIGYALALGLAGAGATVVATYRSDAEGANRLLEAIRSRGLPPAIAVTADISRMADIDALFARVSHSFGRLDVLVNNAAVTGWASVFEVTEALWDQVIDTNLKGTYFCCQRGAALMRESGGGSIVNVSSNIAALGAKNLSVYASSKGGVHALTRQLAVELAPFGIRVNTFAPGPTLVERNLSDDPDYAKTWGAVVPLQRTAAPDEMVGPMLFLASADSSFVTGQVFYADGGWSIAGRLPEAHLEATAARHQPGAPGGDASPTA
jgi:NAD(P)-dependent dehydrogenase (short-subunit alcohol dehydrogenase family)